jgi:hypothetical protein
MYQQRVTAFIDILGFGDLVARSVGNSELQKSISAALSAASPETMKSLDIIKVNEERVPPEGLEKVRRMAKILGEIVLKEHPVCVSYFSDLVVISAEASDLLASQMVLELTCKLSIRLWSEHRLTLRGGIVVGELHHVDGGQIFGPAIGKAYDLEREKAVYPRILIEKSCADHFMQQPAIAPMLPLIESAEEGFSQITLGSCFHYTLTSSAWLLGDQQLFDRLFTEMTQLRDALGAIQAASGSDRVAAKYKWLAENCERHVSQTPYRKWDYPDGSSTSTAH